MTRRRLLNAVFCIEQVVSRFPADLAPLCADKKAD